MKKAALYVRVSTNHQIDKDSLPFQKQELINYAKYALNIDNYEVFEDAGYSGKNTDRPSFQDMMSRIRKNEFTHLIVWKIDRISRNLKDFTEMYDEIKRYNTTFVSKNEQFDTSSAMGEAMLKIILVFAELERKLTAERVYAIMLSRAEKGQWNGAPVPLGYKFDSDTKFPVVDEDEAAKVRFIFDSYLKTKSTNEVKHLLEVNNIGTKRSGSWTTKTIADILRNPFYIGTYRYNYRYSAHGKIRPESDWIVVEDNHAAIVSKEIYQNVNAMLDANFKGRGGDRTINNHTHVFKGLFHCEKCEKTYIATVDRPRGDGYRPSVYRCYNFVHSKANYRTCNGAVSEVKLGPFLINYIANLVRAHNYVLKDRTAAIESHVEELLLFGPEFETVAGIIPADLKHTFDILVKSTGDVLFYSESQSGEGKSFNAELDALEAEKRKFERAYKRLEDLYLFSDDSISEKDFLIKKQDIFKKIEIINAKMKKRSLEFARNLPGHDISFMKKASKYLIANDLFTNEPIDYNAMVRLIDKELLRDFVQLVIKKINMREDRRIASIEFVNGMTHRFVYRDE